MDLEISKDERSEFRKDKPGFVFEQYNMLWNMTIEENISLSLNLMKLEHNKTSEETMKLVKNLV